MRLAPVVVPPIVAAMTGLLAVSAPVSAAADKKPAVVKRLIISLYDGKEDPAKIRTRVHLLATMPLNHLGLIVRQHDIRKGLPDDRMMKHARGVLTWFSSNAFKEPAKYLKWANRHLAAGRRFVVLGHPGVDQSSLRSSLNQRLFELMLARIGLRWKARWNALTYDVNPIVIDKGMYGFEGSLSQILPPFPTVLAGGDGVISHLTVEDKRTKNRSDLVVTGPNGGYVAGQYAIRLEERNGVQRRVWLLNPFKFFRKAYGTDDLPKPDTTTLSGRRMFYSHVDGDAWHNITRIEQYAGTKTVSAKVHFDWIIKGFPDLPVTIGPVTGDIMPSWYGNKAAIALARRIFAAPNVEAGSHTHSHPFAWGFFRRNVPAKEIPYLSRYPARPGKRQNQSVWQPRPKEEKRLEDARADRASTDRDGKSGRGRQYKLSKHYTRPRAYAIKRFSLRSELAGSVNYIQEMLLPRDKTVRVMQWSGNTMPFPAALQMTRKLGIRNINGGDPRMDGRYRSYAWVSGLGRRVANTWQIYSSGANENIYTASWTRNFSAFRQVIDTFRNTESPIRIKPINVYYHFYIMERSDSARSLKLVLDYARTQALAPITTSKFAAIADGFFSARLVRLGKNSWRVENRDGLETIRFDHATLKSVDFAKSTGVIGQRHFQGSLYVALDSSDSRPVITLKKNTASDRAAAASRPYLVQARWRIAGLRIADTQFQFDSSGFGRGVFDWVVPKPGRYRVQARTIGGKPDVFAGIVSSNGYRLRFSVKTNDARLRRFKVTFLEPPR